MEPKKKERSSAIIGLNFPHPCEIVDGKECFHVCHEVTEVLLPQTFWKFHRTPPLIITISPAVPRSPRWPTDHCSSLAASVVISRSRIASPGWHTDHCSSLTSPGLPGDTGHELWAYVSTLKFTLAVQRQSWIRERPWKRREISAECKFNKIPCSPFSCRRSFSIISKYERLEFCGFIE